MCPGDSVVVGMKCGGAECAINTLVCALYTRGDCNPSVYFVTSEWAKNGEERHRHGQDGSGFDRHGLCWEIL